MSTPPKLRRAPRPRKLATKHRNVPKNSKGPIRSRAGQTVLNHEYSPETGHLTVTFHGGRQYRYEGVSKEAADGLASAESKGSFLHSHIVGKFDVTKI